MAKLLNGMMLCAASLLCGGLVLICDGCNSRRGEPESRGNKGDECDLDDPMCAEGLVCDAVSEGDPQCVGPVVIRGTVLDIADVRPIEGALVQAVDGNGAAAGEWAATDAAGAFQLLVPAIRDDDGNPIEAIYTLRVQAPGYQEFPTPIRPALPLDAATAQPSEESDDWIIEHSLTTVGLIKLTGDTSDLGSISGTVQAENHSGILVIAAGVSGARIGFTDSEGLFVIFNVPPGTYDVQGYAAGVQLDATNTTLEAGETRENVDLSESDRPLSTVSGNVQIVNAPGGSQTSVVLSVESTFVESAGRGAVPPGLRVADVTGAFSIENVPDGKYVVLAAFENDRLVRDPDQTIGGTRIVRIEVPDPETGNVISLPEGFKVTAALSVIEPGADAPQAVATTTPTLEWQDDSSEDGFEIRVFDAFGLQIWSDEIGPVSGSATVTHTYAGPDLVPGMFYQFRITSFREKTGERTAISTTEDLRGVFYLD